MSWHKFKRFFHKVGKFIKNHKKLLLGIAIAGASFLPIPGVGSIGKVLGSKVLAAGKSLSPGMVKGALLAGGAVGSAVAVTKGAGAVGHFLGNPLVLTAIAGGAALYLYKK